MKRFHSIITAVFMAALILVSNLPVSAASSSGLSIAPRKDYRVEAGGNVQDSLKVSNLNSNEDLTLSVKVIDFTFMDQSGTPKLYTGADSPTTTWSLKPFVSLPETVKVEAGKTANIDFKIDVPEGQGAGSYYSAIIYSAAGDNGGNVDLTATGVTLVFLSIPGDVNEELKLEKFGAYITDDTDANSGSYVFISMDKPKELAYTLTNKGNVAESPVGSITMRNMFGGKDIVIEDANPKSSLALREQTRLFKACIESETRDLDVGSTTSTATTCKTPSLLPGRYTAKLDIFYGQNGNSTHEITQVATFWYLPLWFIALVIAVILLLAWFIWRTQRKIKQMINGNKPKRFRR